MRVIRSGLKVLIVDDYPDAATSLALLLEAGGEFRYLSGPPVDIAAYVEGSDLPPKRERDFLLYGPPRLLKYLQGLLRPL